MKLWNLRTFFSYLYEVTVPPLSPWHYGRHACFLASSWDWKIKAKTKYFGQSLCTINVYNISSGEEDKKYWITEMYFLYRNNKQSYIFYYRIVLFAANRIIRNHEIMKWSCTNFYSQDVNYRFSQQTINPAQRTISFYFWFYYVMLISEDIKRRSNIF